MISLSDDWEQSHPWYPIYSPRLDKARHILGIKYRRSMEPIPASTRTSAVSSHSTLPEPAPLDPAFPLTTLYTVSGLPNVLETRYEELRNVIGEGSCRRVLPQSPRRIQIEESVAVLPGQ